MKYSILCALFVSQFSMADTLYVKVGTGYKFDEQKYVRLNMDDSQIYEIQNSPYSARLEVGIESGALTYGISHHSQWETGFPFNETGEYYKTEVFIDYRIDWEL